MQAGSHASPPHQGPDPIDLAVGMALRRHRRAQGMSQEELGAIVGVTFQQIQKYERAANRISASVLVKAAEALNVSPGDLLPALRRADPPFAPARPAIAGAGELMEVYARLSPKQRRALVLLMQTMLEDPEPPPGQGQA